MIYYSVGIYTYDHLTKLNQNQYQLKSIRGSNKFSFIIEIIKQW